MKNKIKNLTIFGIILISIFLFIFLASALTPQEEIAQLENELNSAGYDWLVNYSLRDDPHGPNLTYPRVEVYEKDKNDTIATFEKISEDKEYKIYLTNLNGSQNTFDLKVFSPRDDSGEPGGSVWFDYIVDPIILGNANSVNTNTTYENNFTHLNVSNSSIIAYYPFDVNNNSDGITYDYTDKNNDGVKMTGVTFNNTGCIYGNCYTFRGSDASNLTLPNGAGVYGSSPRTLSVWVKTTDTFGAFWAYGNRNANTEEFTLFINSGSTILLKIQGAGMIQWPTSNVLNGNWHNVVLTYNGSTINNSELYLDGVKLVRTELTVGTPNTQPKFFILGMAQYAGYEFAGELDEFMVWNTALTADEVLAIYNNQTNRFFPTGTMNWTGVNFAGNDTINITLQGCQQNMGSSLKASVNDGAFVAFDSNCFIQDYNATGDLNSANVTIQFLAGTNNFYTPLVIGNLSLDNRDAIFPQISFKSPTPANGTISSDNNSIIINTSITELNLNTAKFNWNGTNFTIFNDSTVLHLGLNNFSAIGENGTRVVDVSKYENHGTPNGAFFNSTGGFYGGGYTFDGVNDFINVSDPSSLNITGKITVASWIKLSASQLNAPIVARWGSDQSYLLGVDYVTANKIIFGIRVSEVSKTATSTNTYNDGKWHQVVGVFNGTNVLLYIDGGAEAVTGSATTGPIDGPANNVFIGSYNSLGNFFNGSIDEVRIFDRALSANEVTQLYMSNLQKLNNTDWLLYVNQTKHNSTTGLGNGQYTYFSTAIDTAGNENSTETRTITLDTTNPTFTWNSPTPADKTFSSSNSSYLNATITDASNTSAWFDWNKSVKGYWAMDFRNSTDVFDNSTYSNFGTISGAVANISGKRGDSFTFDGVNDLININTAVGDLAATTKGTWSAWVKPVDATPTAQDEIIAFANGDQTDMIHLMIDITTGNFRINAINNGAALWQVATDVAPFSDNTWTQIALVQDGVSPVLYVNGVAPAQTFSISTDKTIWFNNLVMNNGRIGTRFWDATEGDGGLPFNGNIDEVLIFDRALSANEIKALYDTSAVNNILQNNFTSLSNAKYNYSVYAIDDAGNLNWTSPDRQYTVDTTNPTISYNAQTPTDNSTINSNSIYVNVSVSDTNFENMTYYLYNETLNVSKLVGYWNFDRNTTSVRDLSGNKNDGTRNGGVNWTTGGKLDSGFSFDGVDDFIERNNAVISGTPATFSAWINLKSLGVNQRIVTINPKSAGNSALSIFVDTANKASAQHYDTDGAVATGTTTLTTNTWYHIVGVFASDSSRTIYVNGVSQNTNTGVQSAMSGLNYTSIGDIAWSTGNIQFFNGSIDEPMIFNSALSATEVSELYNRGLVNHTTYSTTTPSINWTGLAENDYNYFVDVIDDAENYNSTLLRSIELDTTFPTISYNSQTPADNSTINSNSIYVNVSVTETNFENMTYYLYNETLNVSKLVGYWNFDRNTTSVRDISGNKNDGTRVGGVNWTTGGKLDSGFSFDGVNDRINIDTAVGDLSTTTKGTLSAWVKPVDATPPNHDTIISFTNSAVQDTFFYIPILPNSGILRVEMNVANEIKWGIDTDASPFSDNTWTHIAIVQDAVSPILYVNGVVPAQTSYSPNDITVWFNGLTSANSGRIGDFFDSSGERLFFNGSIDEPMIFNSALSATEVSELYNRGLVNHTTYSTTTPSINWTGLSENDYNYFVDVIDDAENYNSTLLRSIELDTTNPSIVFANPTTNASNLSQEDILANVTFTEANINITNITLYNSTQNIINSTTGTTSPVYINFSDLENGKYYLNATISDTAGNTNQTETREIILDTINPLLNITFPTNNSFSSITNLSINYTRSDATAGLSTCWYSNDTYTTNTTLADCNNITTVQWAEGQHNLTIWVNDTANNQDWFRITFTIDTTLPVPVFANPTTNSSNLSQNFIQANVSVTETNLNTINISLFNSTQNLINSTAGTTSPLYINFSDLENGKYYLNATVNDSANNKNYTETRTIYLDTVAPNLTINSPIATTYSVSTILFNATAIDFTTFVDSCWYTLNSGATNQTLSRAGTSNSYNFTQTSVADASYTARFYCNDTANNVNNTETKAFTIDTSVPVLGGGGPAPAVGAGGGAGVSKPSPKRIFNLNYNMYDTTISLKQVEFDLLKITNNGEISDDYIIEVKTIGNIISFENNKMSLEPGETKGAEFKISSPKEPGIYTGKIIVTNGISEREVLVTINVKTEKSLFDITLAIPESLKILLTGQNLISKIDLIQMGAKEKIDVTLRYVIKDFEGQTYLQESETIAVIDQKSYEKEFFTSELPPGQYVFGTELIHPDGVAVASTHFVVQEKGFKFGKDDILLTSLILVLILVSLIIFLSIRKYKRVGKMLGKRKTLN